MEDKLYEIIEEPIQLHKLVEKVQRREAGAITTFIGTVREWTKGKKTVYLEYQAYKPMAEKMLAKIGEEIQSKWPNTQVAITHRVGRLDISDVAVFIAVSSPHRKAAYEANEYAIERIKEIVPIWKKEHWEDGDMWIGDQLEKVAYPSGKPNVKGMNEHD
ncbi:molybdopterin synthase catalytic subunit [Salirhabdus euzebyi]|uniref:Molybdopterin synthase catalytic subunit n=1 Tax=Salirhabdus euzebyi TaxID=394506 RepID=A0A841Q6K9_9BACI|nr:molybdenum cofactor biosynthesis protein MoaE [Salirhabdus euzebyi]MBB6454038.1 molybdopterin synthase catalytic subunit [Salirhabdus euzebyi]